MATLTIRNLPDELVERLKLKAKAANRSMEQEVRELLETHYPKKLDTLERIRNRWSQLPEIHHEEMNEWRNEGRP
ncbi:ribbon-helix-helix protein, CopG family [Endozoicomonas sp. 4G]|uniref:FitA-like ribbon-helix-helix domain-containing protein n=1 Tax=Endozoicomonas sp. 4G TaxID=2872754 RepID=UPI002078C030|nr:ribbon-helix-helix protein, CopG family [Endozoicomonas sp. 4G]